MVYNKGLMLFLSFNALFFKNKKRKQRKLF